MHDFSVNRLTVFMCQPQWDATRLRLFLQIIAEARATAAPANAVTAKDMWSLFLQ